MKKIISTVLLASVISTNISPAINVFADEVLKEKVKTIEENAISTAKVNKFNLSNYNNFETYNSKFKIQRDEIKSISNNGGQYSSSSIDKSIDGNLSTHWETGKQNSTDFKNEVIVEFDKIESIDRIAYATRQDGAKGKGYPTKFEVYSSVSGNDEDLKLVSKGSSSSTGNIMEFKFDTITAKKIKFVFVEANQNWASASEFWFYKEDHIIDKLNKVFTDEAKNQLSEEFNTLEKIEVFENEAKSHPFYENVKEDLEDAKLILEGNNVEYKDAVINKFKSFNDKDLVEYNKLFKINTSKISTNGSHYGSSNIEKAIDNNIDTSWHSGKQNSSSFTNEVIITLEEKQSLNRVVYTNLTSRGFAEAFDIYVSTTAKGDTFEKVTSGSMSRTTNSMEIQFNPTMAKRVKFVFKKGYENWALASEFALYKEDELKDKMSRLFTDKDMTQVSDEFLTVEKLTALENEVKNHPFYEDYKEDLANAKLIIEAEDVVYKDAIVSKFKSFNDEDLVEYNKLFKIKNSKISTNGSHYGSSNIEKAIDNNIDTSWHSGKQNSSSFTNEVIITLDELEVLDRVVYTSLTSRGFAKAFDIYVSKTTKGNKFEKVTSGISNITKDSLEIQFNPTTAKRVKFVFTEGHENWALASEFALYKKDELKDKMSRLFTDKNMTQVSDEFATAEKITALEKEAKDHPFYEDYKEDLANAKTLLEQGNIEATKAKTGKFDVYYTEYKENYDNVFKMDNSNISSIITNGNHLGSSSKDRMIDGNLNTYWESGLQNSSSFENEIIFTLDKVKTLDRMAYRSASNTIGFADEFEIYASQTTKGNSFQLVTTGKANRSSDMMEFKFEPTKFKRIKFVYKKGNSNKATASEVMFYSEDKLSEKIENLFKDGLYTELNEEFNSIEAIEALGKELENHPLKELYAEDIALAKELVSNPDKFENVKIITAEQRGKYGQGTSVRSINGAAYASFQSTGLYVTQNEEFVVYVKADANGVMPQICFGQVGKGKGDWRRWTTLKPGKNIIKAPNNINPSAIYIVNEAKPSDQAFAPEIRLEGGTKFPTYVHGETDPVAFAEEVKAYSKKVEYSDTAFEDGNPKGKVFNITELVSENCVITTTAMGTVEALKQMEKSNVTVKDTMNEWEEMYEMFQTFQGFKKDATEEKHSYFPNKFIARVFYGVPLGFADHGYTGYLGSDNAERNGGFFKQIVMPITLKGNDNWCYTHEFGHIFNTKHVVDGEVTNNLYAQEYRRIKGLGGDRAAWGELMKRFQGEEFAMHYFERLGVLSQINMVYGYDAYAKMSTYVRNNTSQITAIKGSDQQRLAIAYSLALNVNLMDFFEGWNYVEVTEQMREVTAHLPKLEKKMEYLHGGAYDYAGNGFNENLNIEVKSKLNEEEKTNTLSFAIDNSNSSDLLGYEILKDKKVIGFTRGNKFVVKEVDVNENDSYEVVAYAKDLSTAEAVNVKTFSPTLTIQQDSMMVGLNSKFNPATYAKGFTYKNEDISDDIKIESNVDTSKKGNYQVKYTLSNNEAEVVKVMEVEVVSAYDYLSDSAWESVEAQWGNPRRNSNIKGRINGEITTFEKGFGIHAKGKIVYNLGEHNYDKFEALLGVDMGISAQDNSSITFKVVADGKTVATTRVLRHSDNMISINVPVKGVKELVIEVHDGGNGNTSDHAVIANPKLSNNNMKPSIKTSELKNIVKLGKEFDLMDGITASDVEDGDLTSSIVVNSNGFNVNKAGRYTIEYEVVDSDNNSETLTRDVVVYSNSVYTSDTDWQSAQSGWQTVRKDKSVSNGTIKMGVDGKTKEFTKGIGTHSNSEIVYDVEGKGYEYFETLVGVDRGLAQNNDASVKFQIFTDGKKVFDSGLMKWTDNAKLAKVNLKDVSELRLVVNDGGNGNVRDHGNFADAKFLITNSKPQLTIPASVSTKVGEEVNLDEEYSATDAEDGDLTSSVKVEGKVNFNKSGKYKMTYLVTDSDKNTTKAVREVKVVNMEDSEYLSDMDWKSAVNSYTAAKKNQSINGNGLRLTDENGAAVTYEKGIGAHSTSTLTYDLTKGDYGYFTSFVGVDRNMHGTVGSVSFEVYLDNEKVYDSGVMTSKQAQKFVEVNLAGAKELKLVVTDGKNGNGSDHAIWADAKLHVAKEGTELETEAKKSLRELVEYADTITIDMVEESKHKETRWYNFNAAKDEAKEALLDSSKTEEDLNSAKWFLNYTIEELKIVK